MATIPRTEPTRHRLSAADYHRMAETGILAPTDRVELIDGEIIDMSPTGALHAAIVARLAARLTRGLGPHAIVWCQSPLRLGDMSEPEPDIAVVRARTDAYMTALPGPEDVHLVIEVADTSLAWDLGVKVPLYARHGIPETWVIDAATRQTRVFRGAGEGRYAEERLLGPADVLSCTGVVSEAGVPLAFSLAELLPTV